MKKLIILLFLAVSVSVVTGQNCDLYSEFMFVKDYFEKNSPAFQIIKSDADNLKAYHKKVAEIISQLKNENQNELSNQSFNKYASLLKDHHSGIDPNFGRINIDWSSQTAVDSFKTTPQYLSFEKMKIDSAKIVAGLEKLPEDDIRGVYTNGGSTEVAVIDAGANKFKAVVLRKNKLLDVGHILFELIRNDKNNSYSGIYYTGLLGFNFKDYFLPEVKYANGQLPNLGFSKTKFSAIENTKAYDFKELDTETNYLQLKSFDYSLKSELDSLYNEIDALIQKKPYLIIDLRDNGGGSEACYLNLMPYLYTQPLDVDEVLVWVTPDNIKRYEEDPTRDKELIERMKNAESNTFISQKEDAIQQWTMEGTEFPKKVAILYNKHTASSAEGMITYAIQSDKVITLGENSGGFIGYGDVLSTQTPCGNFTIRCTTTKYKNNAHYEFVGIPPMIRIDDPSEDWIEMAVATLKSKK